MQPKSDAQLLREYAEHGAETAFAEIVSRHTNLVYSAALRQVDSPDLAADVAQSVFVGLARAARSLSRKLADSASLAGWLCRSARNISLNLRRDEFRRHSRERQAMENLDSIPDATPDWERLRPVLDEAMSELSEPDYDALLIRFFKNQDLRSVGLALGVSDDAAQKRVSRALDKLRDLLSQRGIRTSATALSIILSANAVQAAPAGLAAAISTATALAGTTIATTATASATKAITMTTLQKTVVGATLVAAIGTGVYEAHQSSNLRTRVQSLEQQQAPLNERIGQLSRERDEVGRQLVALRDENERLNRNTGELLKLRGEVGALRRQVAEADNVKPQSKQPLLSSAREYYERAMKHSYDHEHEDQLADLNKAIELDPNFAEALFARANLYAMDLPKKSGGYARAVEDLSRFLELKPNDASARHNRAHYYDQLGQYDNAIADYTTLIEGDTDFTRIIGGKNLLAREYYDRGWVYHRHKDYARAISDYTAALKLDPQMEGAHRLRGECYESTGQSDKALEDFAIEKPN